MALKIRFELENTDDENAVAMRFEGGALHHTMQLAGGTYRMHSADQIIQLLEKAL